MHVDHQQDVPYNGDVRAASYTVAEVVVLMFIGDEDKAVAGETEDATIIDDQFDVPITDTGLCRKTHDERISQIHVAAGPLSDGNIGQVADTQAHGLQAGGGVVSQHIPGQAPGYVDTGHADSGAGSNEKQFMRGF